MNKWIRQGGPVLLTLLVTTLAIKVGHTLWVDYTEAPWTRDGHVRADVLAITPDVSGLITDVQVKDNQPVKKGDLLFIVDRARYELAVQQAEAVVLAQQVQLKQARREAARNQRLSDLVAQESQEAGDVKVQQGEAALAAAQSALNLARLNLARTRITSPVTGYLNDRAPHAGDYAVAGRPVLSVVDAASFHVDGYFEETKLHGLQVKQAVDIRLMGEDVVLHGHVQSIAAAIEDRDRSNGSNLLPNVNPTFNWVRLAQRIPVRISLDAVPAGFHLIAGRTATVSVQTVTQRGGA